LPGSVVGVATQPYPPSGPPPSFWLRNHPESRGFFPPQKIRTQAIFWYNRAIDAGDARARWALRKLRLARSGSIVIVCIILAFFLALAIYPLAGT
jgi:hypothetical protein